MTVIYYIKQFLALLKTISDIVCSIARIITALQTLLKQTEAYA